MIIKTIKSKKTGCLYYKLGLHCSIKKIYGVSWFFISKEEFEMLLNNYNVVKTTSTNFTLSYMLGEFLTDEKRKENN